MSIFCLLSIEEIEVLQRDVGEMERKFDKLQQEHNLSLQEMENTQNKDKQLDEVSSKYSEQHHS